MSDTFTPAASSAIDASKASALASVAQNGAAGQKAIQDAQAQNAAAKTAAIQQALSYAALRGAPGSTTAANAGTVSEPFNARGDSLSEMAANYGANAGAQQSADASYFEGAKAALPTVKANLDASIAKSESAAQIKQMQVNADLQSKALASQLAQAKLAATQNKTQTLGQFLTANGGSALVGNTLSQADRAGADQAIASVPSGPTGKGTFWGNAAASLPGATAPAPGSYTPGSFWSKAAAGVNAGAALRSTLSSSAQPGLLGLLNQTETKQDAASAAAQQVTSAKGLALAQQDPGYAAAIGNITQAAAAGKAPSVATIMQQYPQFTAQQAQSMLGLALTTSGSHAAG